MGVLQSILDAKRQDVAELRTARLPAPPPRRPIALARAPGGPLHLIAEIKRRSPSAGALSTALGVAERAAAYERGGAAIISVLCDTRFFDGSYHHLELARAATRLPLLCKEFVIDEVQLDAARAYGADAVLLIVRCLSAARLRPLIDAARERDLVPVVEVVSPAESQLALDADAEIIGVNARDLDTLEMNPARARSVLAALPAECIAVHLSGLKTPDDVGLVRASRADAALIGEALMRQDDPEPLLQSLHAAASS